MIPKRDFKRHSLLPQRKGRLWTRVASGRKKKDWGVIGGISFLILFFLFLIFLALIEDDDDIHAGNINLREGNLPPPSHPVLSFKLSFSSSSQQYGRIFIQWQGFGRFVIGVYGLEDAMKTSSLDPFPRPSRTHCSVPDNPPCKECKFLFKTIPKLKSDKCFAYDILIDDFFGKFSWPISFFIPDRGIRMHLQDNKEDVIPLYEYDERIFKKAWKGYGILKKEERAWNRHILLLYSLSQAILAPDFFRHLVLWAMNQKDFFLLPSSPFLRWLGHANPQILVHPLVHRNNEEPPVLPHVVEDHDLWSEEGNAGGRLVIDLWLGDMSRASLAMLREGFLRFGVHLRNVVPFEDAQGLEEPLLVAGNDKMLAFFAIRERLKILKNALLYPLTEGGPGAILMLRDISQVPWVLKSSNR